MTRDALGSVHADATRPRKSLETVTVCNILQINSSSTIANRREVCVEIMSSRYIAPCRGGCRLCGIVTLRWLLVACIDDCSQVLDRIEIVETPRRRKFISSSIRERCTCGIRLLKRVITIRIFLDFPEQDRSRRFARELAVSPPSDLIPKFRVTFPDQGTNGLSIELKNRCDSNQSAG